jgi:uncharacterized membrane protein
MPSPASIRKHPLHPMFVGFPLGLWVFALVCDVVRAWSGNPVWGRFTPSPEGLWERCSLLCRA